MSERVAIVARADGGGAGRATAKKLAAAGFTVAGVDRSEEGMKELPDSIRREAALPHLTRLLDLELRPLRIRVNAVAPQLTCTAKNRPYLTPDLLAHAVTPEAVAGIIVYLVSGAAAPVSGAIVPACGA